MRGVFVCGTSRSGTSMTAGLFREHGVFFGDTYGAYKGNAKGNLENKWLKGIARSRSVPGDWPDPWFANLRREGWDGEAPWGAKLGPESWFFMERTAPTVVVLVWRPVADILDSRKRTPGMGRIGTDFIHASRGRMRAIRETASCPVVDIDTPSLVGGEYDQALPAFDALGIDFSADIACDWIDPDLFHA